MSVRAYESRVCGITASTTIFRCHVYITQMSIQYGGANSGADGAGHNRTCKRHEKCTIFRVFFGVSFYFILFYLF